MKRVATPFIAALVTAFGIATAMTIQMCGVKGLISPMTDGICAATDTPAEVFSAFLVLGCFAGMFILAIWVGILLFRDRGQ
ncbi:hypothetical protein BVC71_10035 [Marivivens niveibacter]|uniref:Uncharacterized protein n=1 Tax=Marivivens niveibacter TaxID=1930667 RepID=A0A251WYM3_9RHOB|nr:hypothetical protein [Marivivens niveibacter]OUD09043.1 hypothetical protein BVC71_10035 [Marivivens niveibacter]